MLCWSELDGRRRPDIKAQASVIEDMSFVDVGSGLRPKMMVYSFGSGVKSFTLSGAAPNRRQFDAVQTSYT